MADENKTSKFRFVPEDETPSTKTAHIPKYATEKDAINAFKGVPFDRATEIAQIKKDIAENYVPKSDVPAALKSIQELEGKAPSATRFVDDTNEEPAPNRSIPALTATGAALGAGFGLAKDATPHSLMARLVERLHGLPEGGLGMLEHIQSPESKMPLRAAADVLASQLTPPTAAATSTVPENVAALPAAADKLPSMQRWTNSQVGENSALPSAKVAEITSTYAADPTGAPQEIQRQAGRTRLARSIVPESAMQRLPGGTIPFVESPRAQRAYLQGNTANQQLAAMDRAMAAPRESTAVPSSSLVTPARQNIVNAANRSQIGQRASNAALGGLFGAGTVRQAIDVLNSKERPDLETLLSLGGNALGTLGAVSSRIPQTIKGFPVIGPLATLAQLPYAYKHREDIMRGLTMGDVMPPTIASGEEVSAPAFNFRQQ